MSEMCSTLLAENTGLKNDAKNRHYAHHRTTLFGYIFATKARPDSSLRYRRYINHLLTYLLTYLRIDNRKNLVKQQCLPHMSAQ